MDRPTAIELIEAVRQHLEKEILPTLSDSRLRFQTRVASNVLTIVERELTGEEDLLREEWRTLATILGEDCSEPTALNQLRDAIHAGNERLCSRIRNGEYSSPESWKLLRDQVRGLVVRKLEVNNPRYLANCVPEPDA